LCWSIVANGTIAVSGLIAQLLERTFVAGAVAPVVDGGVAHPVSARDQIAPSEPSDDGWALPFAFADPRARVGMILFVVLGFGALCLATAGVPRRIYAGAGLTQQNTFALRLTLGLAGLVLLLAAGIGQLAG
jgi:hypothetical protein